MATHVVSKTDLRERIRAELAGLGDDTLLITDRGRPSAVVIAVGRWNDLQQSLEDLEDTVAILEQRMSRQKTSTAEAAFARIESEDGHLQSPARKTG
ncbi:MAG: hypothetical protein ACR2FO_03500 [Actinomycetota bacterium]